MSVLVNLKKDWFAPDGSLYQPRDNPHEFPSHWADDPKQGDDESDEDFAKRKKGQPFAVLPSTAELVEGGRTVAVLQDTANGEQIVVAQAVDDDTKSVGGALNDKGQEEGSQTVAAAAKGAEALEAQVGGKPQHGGPLPAGEKKK